MVSLVVPVRHWLGFSESENIIVGRLTGCKNVKNSNLERSFKCRLATWSEILMSASLSLSLIRYVAKRRYAAIAQALRPLHVSICVHAVGRCGSLWATVGVGDKVR